MLVPIYCPGFAHHPHHARTLFSTRLHQFHLPLALFLLSLVAATMLPFASIGEAEVAMGRDLTAVETAWFRYSAGMSDFWLYAHNVVFLLLVYTLAPLPFVMAELKRPKAIQKYKLQPSVHFPVATFVRCYKNVVKTFIVAVGPLQLLSYPTIKVKLMFDSIGYI